MGHAGAMYGRSAPHTGRIERHHPLQAMYATWVAVAAGDARGWRWARRVALAAIVVAVGFIGLGNAHGALLTGTISGPATYTAADPSNDNLTVTLTGNVYTFSDPNDTITASGDCNGGGSPAGTPATCPDTISSLTINLLDRDDSVTLSSTGVLTTINGGIDTDQVIVLGENTNFTLTDTSLTVGGSTFTLSGFEDANLTGGGGANTFDVGAWSGSASLDGAGGTDTITDTLASNGTGFTLSDNSLTRTGGSSFSLDNFAGETADLTGDGSDNTFTVGTWTGDASVDGGAGADHRQLDEQRVASDACRHDLHTRRVDVHAPECRDGDDHRRLKREHDQCLWCEHRRHTLRTKWQRHAARWKRRRHHQRWQQQRHADRRPRRRHHQRWQQQRHADRRPRRRHHQRWQQQLRHPRRATRRRRHARERAVLSGL